jgi:enoyl-CoA hydratase/carnithine racemase
LLCLARLRATPDIALKMGILDRIFTAERTLRWVGKLARRQPLFISALKSALIQPEVTSMVQMSSYSQTIRRARPALASGIVPDAMLSRLTLPDDANPAGMDGYCISRAV